MAKWIASLSDGRTMDEEKFSTIEGGLSPWRQLLEILDKDNVTVTGFRIQANGVTYTAPSNAKLAKFPSEFPARIQHRKKASLNGNGESEHYYGYFVTVDKIKIYQWIDSITGDSWLQIVEDSPK